MNNEEQHNDIREKLRKLPRVKARDGFENELLRRINLLEPLSSKSPAQKSSFLEFLFGKKALIWTIPATSLAVIGIVFLAVYLSMYNSDVQKKSVSENQTNSASDSQTQETGKNKIPGKDIANDLEIGKPPSIEKRDEINNGLNETYDQLKTKPVNPTRENVIDSRKESPVYEKAIETGKTGINPKEKDEGSNKEFFRKEENSDIIKGATEPDKRISSPLLKDVDKVKGDKRESETKDNIESKLQDDSKIKESVKKKEEERVKQEIKKKEELKAQEEARKKEEIRKKEEAKRIEEMRAKEEARKKEEIRKKEEAKRKEEIKAQEEARRKEEARKKEEEKRKEDAKKKEELEKLKEKINDN